MNFFSRHKNTVVLATVLLAQFLSLAVQVKRQTAEGPVRLIRLLTVSAFAPFERLFIYSGQSVRGVWTNYIDLRNVRSENARLKAESEQMRLERAREQEDARQARRIQALLGFKEQWIDATVAAQVIGTSGTESSRVLYLDKGTKDGIRADMPVITPDGVVGKVLTVYGETAQVLLMNDPTSGVGATLVNSRLQGIVKGTSTGEVQLNYIMGDETVQPGEALVTSGGDRVFPKGLPIGTVASVSMGRNLFLEIKVKPAADLDRLEEVLVITEQKLRAPDTAGLGPIRASDILAQHLPGVPSRQPCCPATARAGRTAMGNLLRQRRDAAERRSIGQTARSETQDERGQAWNPKPVSASASGAKPSPPEQRWRIHAVQKPSAPKSARRNRRLRMRVERSPSPPRVGGHVHNESHESELHIARAGGGLSLLLADVGGLAGAAGGIAGVFAREDALLSDLRFWIVADDLFCGFAAEPVERNADRCRHWIAAGCVHAHAFRRIRNCKNTGWLRRVVDWNPDRRGESGLAFPACIFLLRSPSGGVCGH